MIDLLLSALLLLTSCSIPVGESQPLMAATISGDCAPWDGPAFTISIPYGSEAAVSISIWQAPNIQYPTTISFPDPTGRVGNAVYRTEAGGSQTLHGFVSLDHVEFTRPVTGSFDLASASGRQFRGRFEATWRVMRALCA